MQDSLRARLNDELDALREKNLYRRLRVVDGQQKAVCFIDGKEVINLSSNNYLGFDTHPHLMQKAEEATREHGVGSGAVRTIIGTMRLHEALERRLADFQHADAVLTFQCGLTAHP